MSKNDFTNLFFNLKMSIFSTIPSGKHVEVTIAHEYAKRSLNEVLILISNIKTRLNEIFNFFTTIPHQELDEINQLAMFGCSGTLINTEMTKFLHALTFNCSDKELCIRLIHDHGLFVDEISDLKDALKTGGAEKMKFYVEANFHYIDVLDELISVLAIEVKTNIEDSIVKLFREIIKHIKNS